jgi:hypothetical protein
MKSKERFAALLGKVLLNCGLLEFLTTMQIDWLSRDSILSDEVAKMDFSRRIDVLNKLLRESTSLPASEIKSLCKQLRRIAQGRNEVAHNPIWPDEHGTYILVARQMSDLAKDKRVTEKDLNALLDHTRAVIRRMNEIPVDPTQSQGNPPAKAEEV